MIEDIKVNMDLSGWLCELTQESQSLAAFFIGRGDSGRPRQ